MLKVADIFTRSGNELDWGQKQSNVQLLAELKVWPI
jgi:hypothetical protein